MPPAAGLTHPVEVARTRLDHALRHCDALENEVRTFLDKEPYRAVREDHGHQGVHVVRAEVLHQPPARIGMYAEDAINSIRTALDEMFWSFARLHHDPPTDPKIRFPIYKDVVGMRRSCWNVDGLIRIKSVAFEVGEAVKAVQPCFRSQDPAGDPLWVLEQLRSHDAHTHITPTGGATGRVELDLRGPEFDARVTGPYVNDGAFHDGDVLAGYEVQPGPHVDFLIEFDFAFYVSLAASGALEGVPLVELVRYLHDHVRYEVLPLFESL